MPWYFPWSESVKKRACRYVLQHYLGYFLKEKLSLDQLSVDIYNGKGTIRDISLDVEFVNETLENLRVPLELVDGFVESISVAIPWSSLFADNTTLEVRGLELTLQPKSRKDKGPTLEAMFNSMTSMASSLQLAEECLKTEKNVEEMSQRCDGVEVFAHAIDSVLSRVKVIFHETVIRLEHPTKESGHSVAVEMRIQLMEYFDDLAESQNGTVDKELQEEKWEPAAVAHKNLRLLGIAVYSDEFPKNNGVVSRKSSSGSPSQIFESARSSAAAPEAPTSAPQTEQLPSSSGAFPFSRSQPVQIASLMGQQEFKLKLKQNESIAGPKLEVECQLGSLNVLMCPRQVHILLELMCGLTSPVSFESSHTRHHAGKNKPMDSADYQRVEHQLQSGRLRQQLSSLSPGMLGDPEEVMIQSLGPDDLEDELYYSMTPGKAGSVGDMESSCTSTLSSRSASTVSTRTTSTGSRKDAMAVRVKDPVRKLLDDPSAELTKYRLKLNLFSLSILHENPTTTPGDQLSPEVPAIEKLKRMSEAFFSKVRGIAASGITVDLKELRKKLSEACPHDHLGCLGKPLVVNCNQKTSASHESLTLDVSLGLFEMVECLFDRGNLTAPLMGFTLPIDHKLPEYSELLIFKNEAIESGTHSLFSSLHGHTPSVKISLVKVEKHKLAQRSSAAPRTDINIELGQFTSEVDITIVDRINSLLKPEPCGPSDQNSSRLVASTNSFSTVISQHHLNQLLDDGPSIGENIIDFHVSSPLVTLYVRFPIPDLRSGPQVDRLPWWRRTLRKEQLILELSAVSFQTSPGTSDYVKQLEVKCVEIHGLFQEDDDALPISFIRIGTDEDASEREYGFNWPRMVIKWQQKLCSVLEEAGMDSDESLTFDSLNGACQFAKSEPSPFSAKKSMYGKEELSDKSELKHVSEERVLPGDKDELKDFQEKTLSNSGLIIDVFIPAVNGFLPSKQFYEILYNRICNDFLLWEPTAPSPLYSHDQSLLIPQSLDATLRVQYLFPDMFETCKSGMKYESDSESDESLGTCSFSQDLRHRRRTKDNHLQSKISFCLNMNKGKVTAFTPQKDNNGVDSCNHHGELVVTVEDANTFLVVNHNGDPELQYLCFQANRGALYHNGCVENLKELPVIKKLQASQAMAEHLYPTIYKSEPGVFDKTAWAVGCGPDTLDMLTIAVKIKLNTKLDTFSNPILKEFVVALGVHGGTMRHRMTKTNQSWFIQALDFLNIEDHPIQGCILPKILTELHVHLWDCTVDYRPLHIPLRTMLVAKSFSLSSNIVAESSTSLLRFEFDNTMLFLSNNLKAESVNLFKDYVCVADIERFDLSLRTSDGKDQRYPKLDLKVSNNRFNIRTCSDSCRSLMELIQYFASDGDLEGTAEEDKTVCSGTKNNAVYEESREVLDGAIMDSAEHVYDMMEDAMKESTHPSASKASVATRAGQASKATEVFFIPHQNDAGLLQQSLHAPDTAASLKQIVVSPSSNSVTSSTFSDKTEKFSDDEDFCMIDDPGLGIAPRNGEPTVKVYSRDLIQIKENYFCQPMGRTDILKSPEYFPQAEYSYMLKEMTIVWYIYGGRDFSSHSKKVKKKAQASSADRINHSNRSPLHLPGRRSSKEEALLSQQPCLYEKGGPQRESSVLMEIQLTKVRMQHEVYPSNMEQVSRQVLLIHDVEVRDRLTTSPINKFLYQYTSENVPRQTHANMVLIKALHSRPDSSVPAEECALKVSLLPIRLNIDQDALFFLRKFFLEVSNDQPADSSSRKSTENDVKPSSPRPSSTVTPPPVMTLAQPPPSPEEPDPQELLIMFDEIAMEQERAIESESLASAQTETDDSRKIQPIFFKSYVFSPDVLIIMDYHGKRVDMEQGTLAGLLVGLAQLNCSQLKLKRLNYRHGLLGISRVIAYTLNEWLADIKKNQLPSILGGVGPIHSLVQLAQGLKDLFWLPIEQYRRDGRIVRGIQRGASSFTTSTAMAVLELTNRLVKSIQYVAELTFDMVSPGPSVRLHAKQQQKYKRAGQPTDLREGMTNAYIVFKQGFTDTASNIVHAATVEHEQKGMTGAIGGVIRQIPPTMVKPLIITSEAAANVLGGMRNQLVPDARREAEEKWKLPTS